MNQIDLLFNISPVPASRPRVTRWGTYYGKKYKQFKLEMGLLVLESDKPDSVNPIIWLDGLISADMTFFVPMARSWSNKKKSSKNGQFCDNNSDLDNYEKAILDSLNGVYFHDDKQIVQQSSQKIWAEQGSIKIILKEITNDN
jgi:Holliday junction resolvase RusA-like endonuclease